MFFGCVYIQVLAVKWHVHAQHQERNLKKILQIHQRVVFSCKTFNHSSDFERQVARMTNPHRVLPERSKSDRSSSMAFFIGLEKTVPVATEVTPINSMKANLHVPENQHAKCRRTTVSMWALSKNSSNPNDLIKDTPKQMINCTCLSKGPHVICMASFWPSSDVESTS